MIKLLILLSLCLNSILVFSSDVKYTLLKETRSKIHFPEISDGEKLKIVDFSLFLFENTYVNLEHKKQIYKVDPVQSLHQLKTIYADLSTDEFHEEVLKIYNSVNDFHVNYNLPTPYSCYVTTLPFSFRIVSDGKIYVSKVKENMKPLFTRIDKISVGDELLKYDHTNPLEEIKNRDAEIPASTAEGKIDQGVLDLYWRSHIASLLPKKNHVRLKLKKINGKVYSLKVPFLAHEDKACVENQNKSLSLLIPKAPIKRLEKLKLKNLFWNDQNSTKENNLGRDTVDLSKLNTTEHRDLFWKVVTYKNKSMGYLKLTSFEEYDLGPRSAFLIKKLLLNELKDTEGLLIDVRGNYGGQIPFAERFSSLFTEGTPKVAPFYIKANPILLRSFEDSLEKNWLELLLTDHESNKLIGPESITPLSSLNSYFKRSYFKPVSILTNSECFSSCDIFAGIMKDNNQVTIYGTSRSTFGGGANFWRSSIFEKLLNITFENNLSMRMTIRQSRRISDNSIIEDRGVPTDVYLPETVEDLKNPEQSRIVAQIFSKMI
jgi:hypothetical protein